MKCSESWLREWVNPDLTREKLSETLTMAGLEVEDCAPVASEFSGVVVGQVLAVEKHPEAERLHICEVNVGADKKLKIVCGANNVKAGMKIPVAIINAVLPHNKTITPTVIRGIPSEGMLCSASELGLADESDGLLELPKDATLGEDLKSYMQLHDYVFDISITPNRGDCLSVRGLAREISALTHAPLLKTENIADVKITRGLNVIPIEVEAKSACPVYVGCIITNVKADAETPTWLRERLRRSGIRSISPVVDVTNYVMLELGQPMHAFNLDSISKNICVRMSRKGERIALLDGSEKELDSETLVIADNEKPLAIAGVMGGMDSCVTSLTNNIFLESAFFPQQVVAKQRQQYGLASESAYRFERGVDPTIQQQAIIRAAQLIVEIAGGEVGLPIEVISKEHLPKHHKVTLSVQKVADVLGITIPEREIESILKALVFPFTQEKNTFIIDVPTHRFDITLPEDIIEEIARLYGYHRIPTHTLKGQLQPTNANEGAHDLQPLRQLASDLGYHEVITYSFVDKKLQALLDPDEKVCELVNPITADMTVMRTNLWPGLVNALLYNRSRQQHRVRLYEIGTCFISRDKQLLQQSRIGGLIAGIAAAEQWGIPAREVDFYDLKGDVEKILSSLMLADGIVFKPETHKGLHPGQSAGIYSGNKRLGLLGSLHPTVIQALDITGRVFVYELDLSFLLSSKFSHVQPVSKFPEIRRDLAILVNQAIPARDIQDTIKVIAGSWLKDVFIFDVYQGKGIAPGLKSIALALVLQHPTRTLIDDEVTDLMNRVVATLKEKLGAELRS